MSERGVYRSIYSALTDDPDYQALPSKARLVLLTARICKQAGPIGIFRYYPTLLSEQAGLSMKDVESALAALEDRNWILREGPILWIRNALRHDPSMHLKNKKHLHAITEWLKELPRLQIVLDFCHYYEIAKPFDSLSDSHTNGPRYIGRLKTEDGRLKTEDVESTHMSAAPPVCAHPTDGFAEFWEAYPPHRRVAKADAVKAWCTLKPDPTLRQTILAALAAQKQRPDWQPHHEGGKYIPHPHRWLGKRRWEDAPPAAQASLLTEKTAGNLDAAKRFVDRATKPREDR
jgi:hypothetical protein